jgi:hypothetical protein
MPWRRKTILISYTFSNYCRKYPPLLWYNIAKWYSRLQNYELLTQVTNKHTQIDKTLSNTYYYFPTCFRRFWVLYDVNMIYHMIYDISNNIW